MSRHKHTHTHTERHFELCLSHVKSNKQQTNRVLDAEYMRLAVTQQIEKKYKIVELYF